jgi:hypothetical protein
MKIESDKALLLILTIISFVGLMVFPFLARMYTFESWIQYHYRVEGTEIATPAFLVAQRDLWWLWFSFPVAIVTSFIGLFIDKINVRTQIIVLFTLFFIFSVSLIACLHKTFWIWLSTFGKMW